MKARRSEGGQVVRVELDDGAAEREVVDRAQQRAVVEDARADANRPSCP
jgi:hypothetical protein